MVHELGEHHAHEHGYDGDLSAHSAVAVVSGAVSAGGVLLAFDQLHSDEGVAGFLGVGGQHTALDHINGVSHCNSKWRIN